jgi:ribosomal 50S subunit-recycling heat shock protein
VRIDIALKRLLLVKSRTEGKEACDVGAVFINGARAKASAEVKPGDILRVDYAERTIELELLGEVGKSVSRTQAKALYRIVSDERVT